MADNKAGLAVLVQLPTFVLVEQITEPPAFGRIEFLMKIKQFAQISRGMQLNSVTDSLLIKDSI